MVLGQVISDVKRIEAQVLIVGLDLILTLWCSADQQRITGCFRWLVEKAKLIRPLLLVQY